jgi:hypothetical protein
VPPPGQGPAPLPSGQVFVPLPSGQVFVPLPSGQVFVPVPSGQPRGEVPLPMIMLPPAPSPSVVPGVVAPPVAGEWRGDEGQVSLISPAERSVTKDSPWVVMLAAVLAAEVAVFWMVTCVGLWRRRITDGRGIGGW